MQRFSSFSLDTYDAISETRLDEVIFPLFSGDRIFLSGDLWSGKSTLVRALLRHHFSDESLVVRSPTYTYYQKYGTDIYHFDLYRVESYDDLLSLGIIDILDDPLSICIIEWPTLLLGKVLPRKSIDISSETPLLRSYKITSYTY